MRKHASHVWMGLVFLVLISRMLPRDVEMLAPIWPSSAIGATVCWATLGLFVYGRGLIKAGLDWKLGVVAFDAYLVSLIAAATGIQLLPELAAAGLLGLAAQAFGDALLGVAAWPLLITSFAYIIAPSSSLVQADHPVQYRDRENASKFLLGAAGVALLYRVLTTLV